MLNSTKTWQERFAEIIKPFCYEEYGKIYFGKQGEELRAEGILITIEQFISDLRKKDEEELIKMLPDYRMVFPEQDTEDIIKYKLGFNDGIQKIKRLIKDYYEN